MTVFITYDSQADAVYIKLLSGQHQVTTQSVDPDVNIDFDESQRLYGIEILGASKRLDLGSLLPIDALALHDNPSWEKLRRELQLRKESRIPVETLDRRSKNWVVHVGADYVTLERDRNKNRVDVTWNEIEQFNAAELKKRRKLSVVKALRSLAA